MSYRYNTTDIVVSVGLCAILFGALLLFMAANGSYQVTVPQSISLEQPSDHSGMIWLQPALGQAIVDQALMERHVNQALAHSVSEWNHVTMMHHDWQSGLSRWLGTVISQGMTVPADHLARVQTVMGRAIVNFTNRGVRNGLLSADQDGTMYNMRMISAAEGQGQRMHDTFASTWQSALGRRIVEAAQHDWFQTGAIQERLGSTVVQVAHAQMNAENGRMAQQEQLARLIFAAVRHEVITDHPLQTTVAPGPVMPLQHIAIASTEPASWPEVPMGYLMVASILLASIFLAGLSMAAQSREAKTLAQMRQDADRWEFRMAV